MLKLANKQLRKQEREERKAAKEAKVKQDQLVQYHKKLLMQQ